MTTVVVRSGSGVLFEMDVPAAGHAAELWQEKIAKGDLVIVTDPVAWVDAGEGARRLVVVATVPRAEASPVEAVPAEAPRRGRPPKVTPTTESDQESVPNEEG